MKKLTLLLAMSLALLISGFAHAVEDTQYELALEHYNNGNFEEAIDILEDYISQNPKPEAYFLVAYSLYKLGRHDEANEYFNDLFLIDPEYSPTPALIEEGRWPPDKISKEAVAIKPEKPAVKPLPVEPVVEKPEEAAVESPAAVPVVSATPAPSAAPEVLAEKVAPKPPVPAAVPKPAPAMLPMAINPIIFIAIGIAIYILISLPIFLLARKRNVSASWIAWIPLVHLWILLKAIKSKASTGEVSLEEYDLDKEPTLDIGDTSFLDEEVEQPEEGPASAEEGPSFFEEETEQPKEEPAAAGEEPSFFEEETEKPDEEPAAAGEEPAGWGEPDEEQTAWGEPGEEQSEDEPLTLEETGDEQSENEPLTWGETSEESDEESDSPDEMKK